MHYISPTFLTPPPECHPGWSVQCPFCPRPLAMPLIIASLVSSDPHFHYAVCAWRQSAAGQASADTQTQVTPAARGSPGSLLADKYLQVSYSRYPHDTVVAVLARPHAAHGHYDDAQQITHTDPPETTHRRISPAVPRGNRRSRNLRGRPALGQSNQTWHWSRSLLDTVGDRVLGSACMTRNRLERTPACRNNRILLLTTALCSLLSHLVSLCTKQQRVHTASAGLTMVHLNRGLWTQGGLIISQAEGADKKGF